jgi:hypothetical protein
MALRNLRLKFLAFSCEIYAPILAYCCEARMKKRVELNMLRKQEISAFSQSLSVIQLISPFIERPCRTAVS